MKKCSYCHEEIEETLSPCPHCRSNLQADPHRVPLEDRAKAINGWLFLPALFFAVQIYSGIKKMILDPIGMQSRGFIRVYWSPPALIYNLIFIALVLMAMWLFFRKRRLAPAFFILTVLYAFIGWVILGGVINIPGDEPIIAVFFNMILFPAYFIYSRRVETVFVNELEPSTLDVLFRWLERPLMAGYLFLRNHRKLFPVLLILFLVTGVLAQDLIRSLF